LKYGISEELALMLEKVGKYGARKRRVPHAKRIYREKIRNFGRVPQNISPVLSWTEEG